MFLKNEHDMRRILFFLLVTTVEAYASKVHEATRPVSQGVVAVPFQRHFETCSLPSAPSMYKVRMHDDGRVLLYAGSGLPARRAEGAVTAFEACLRRFGQQR